MKKPLSRRQTALAWAAAETLEDRRLLSGTLDTTWGNGGTALEKFVGPDDVSEVGIATGPGGTTIEVGSDKTNGTTKIVRYTSSGVLDGTFGTGGIVSLTNTLANPSADAVAVQPDGKILLSLGTAGVNAAATPFQVLRLNLNGTTDTNFGTGGTASINFAGGNNIATSVALTSTGEIVVAGQSNHVNNQSSVESFFTVALLTSNGSLDNSFAGGAGVVITPYPVVQNLFSSPVSVAVDSSDRIVVNGIYNTNPNTGPASGYTVFLARFTASGTLDSTFNGNGFVSSYPELNPTTPIPFAIGSAGQIDLTESVPGSVMGILQYTSAGILDPSFQPLPGSPGQMSFNLGANGTQQLPGTFDAIRALSSGDIVGVGALISDGSLFSAVVSSAGAMKSVAPFTPASLIYHAIIAADGSATFGGGSTSINLGTLHVIHLTSAGIPDSSFGTNGSVVTTFNGPIPSGVTASLLQPDGKLLMGGHALVAGTSTEFALTRFNADGTLDTSFGDNGQVITRFTPGNYSHTDDVLTGLAVEPNGDILAAGYEYLGGPSVPVVARYTPAGVLDTSFGSGGSLTFPVSAPYSTAYFDAVAVQPNGGIVVTGRAYQDTFQSGQYFSFAVQLTGNGVVETSFGNGGSQFTIAGGWDSIAVDSNSDILLGSTDQGEGYSSGGGKLIRLLPNGQLDNSFGSGGVRAFSAFIGGFSEINAITMLPNQDILIGGTSWVSPNGGLITVPAVAELTPTGAFDPSFNGSGLETSMPSPFIDGSVHAMAVLGNGDILTDITSRNFTTPGEPITLMAFLPTGGVDASFGTNGSATSNVVLSTGVGFNNGSFSGMSVRANGNIVVAGNNGINNSGGMLAAQFVGIAPPVASTISGTVKVGTTPLAGETVYLDANNNSSLDQGELSTTTDSNGNFTFSNVSNGAYTLRQALPAGYSQTVPASNAGYTLNFSSGTTVLNANFTDALKLGSISGTITTGASAVSGATVFLDANNNGTLDAGELSTVTDSNGAYGFTNVPVGSYTIVQIVPAGDTQTSPAGGAGIAVSIVPGSILTNENFTDSAPGTVSGSVTFNGQPIVGETIYLDANASTALYPGELNADTNANGIYTFTKVPPGTYQIIQIPANGSTQISPAGNASIPVTVASGSVLTNENFVNTAPSPDQISGKVTANFVPLSGATVFADLNMNGKLDPGEPSSVTDTTGTYSITNIPFGDTGVVEIYPAGYTAVQPAANGYGMIVGSGTVISNLNFTDAGPAILGSVSGNVTAASGPVTGAKIFLDTNGNSILDSGELSTTTNSSGAYSFTNVPINTYTIDQILPAGYSQVSPAGSSGIAINLFTNTAPANENFVDAPALAKLTGTTIGTPGSYKNDGNTIAKATDGNLTTFFDAPAANGNWVGLDLGAGGGVVRQIKYVSRSGFAGRMNGGIFQASNSPTFASGVVNLYTIPANANPGSTSLTTQTLTNTTAYRYYRYLSPNNSYGNVSEVQFFGTPGVVKTLTKLTGITIGTPGSYLNDGNTIAKATDGNLTTFFDGATANSNWVGLDLGTQKVIQQIAFAPRSGFASRMIGGIFQASNTADFSSGVVNLYTVTTAPAAGVLTNVTISVAAGYRYVRYLSPNGSSGNVAEIAFYG